MLALKDICYCLIQVDVFCSGFSIENSFRGNVKPYITELSYCLERKDRISWMHLN